MKDEESMRIRWTRVLAAVLAVVATAALLMAWPSLLAFIKSVGNVSPYATPEERTMGLIAFGLMALFVLALVRILTQGPRR